jgi:uncharacterized protein (TIGR02217 family)
MLSQRFPDAISFQATGGPEFLTEVVAVEGGSEFRNGVREFAMRRYEVSHAARLEKRAKQLIAFFNVARGRLNSFRFKDWSDFKAESGEGGWAAIDGGYQMAKVYASGSDTFTRLITKPVSGTVTVTGNTGGTIDYATGILTGGTGTPTAWLGEFDVPCRFDIDRMELVIIDRNKQDGLIYQWSDIPIVEVPE